MGFSTIFQLESSVSESYLLKRITPSLRQPYFRSSKRVVCRVIWGRCGQAKRVNYIWHGNATSIGRHFVVSCVLSSVLTLGLSGIPLPDWLVSAKGVPSNSQIWGRTQSSSVFIVEPSPKQNQIESSSVSDISSERTSSRHLKKQLNWAAAGTNHQKRGYFGELSKNEKKSRELWLWNRWCRQFLVAQTGCEATFWQTF